MNAAKVIHHDQVNDVWTMQRGEHTWQVHKGEEVGFEQDGVYYVGKVVKMSPEGNALLGEVRLDNTRAKPDYHSWPDALLDERAQVALGRVNSGEVDHAGMPLGYHYLVDIKAEIAKRPALRLRMAMSPVFKEDE